MPTPSRTSEAEILRAAAALLEQRGLDALTMQAVAVEVGVRAPSLYRHVGGRDELLRRLASSAAESLGRAMDDAVRRGADASTAPSAADRVLALAGAARRFAQANPAAYRLVFAPPSEVAGPSVEVLERAAGPVLAVAAELAAPGRELEAARTLTAWVHGFITMELAGAFRLGAGLDDAFVFGAHALAAALDGR